jgi:hypothetical protein
MINSASASAPEAIPHRIERAYKIASGTLAVWPIWASLASAALFLISYPVCAREIIDQQQVSWNNFIGIQCHGLSITNAGPLNKMAETKDNAGLMDCIFTAEVVCRASVDPQINLATCSGLTSIFFLDHQVGYQVQ